MKKLMLFSTWLAATAGAVGVAWAGVSVVDNQVVAPPSVTEVASAPASATTTVIEADATAAPSMTSTTNQPTSRPTTASAARPAPTTTPSTRPTSATPSPTPAPVLPPTPAITKTFALTGGTAAVSFSSTAVEVLWATPNPGFDVSIEPESPGIKVEFRADHHRSRVDAWWSGGPQHSIGEEPRD